MLSRAFVILWVAMLITMIGISMVSPLLPIYVRDDLQGPEIAVALSFSGIAIPILVLSPIAGRMGDRYGAKPLIVFGFLVYAVSGLGFVVADTWELVVGFRMLSGIGAAAFFPMAMAYVGRLAPLGREGEMMGIYAVAEVAGFGVGPLIGGVVKDLVSANAAFLLMSGMLLVMGALVWLALPPERRRPRRLAVPVPGSDDNDGGEPFIPMLQLIRIPLAQAALAVQTITAIGWGSGATFLVVYVVSEDGLDTGSAAFAGLLLAARSLIGGLVQPYSGRLADRLNRTSMIAGGLLVAGSLQFFVPDVPSTMIGERGDGFVILPWLVALYVAVGLSEAVVVPAQRAIFVDVGRTAGMGSIMGLNQMSGSGGFLIGSLVGALVVELFGLEAAFRFTGIVVVAGALLFLVLTRRPGPDAARTPTAAAVGDASR